MRSRRQSSAAETDLTPALDIVFILLIFFIVTATFLKEQAMPMTPPPPGASPVTQPAIVVSLSADGLIRVDGRLTDIGAVRALIERALAENPEQSVLVQAHPQTRNQLVILAVDKAYSAGASAVGFTLSQT